MLNIYILISRFILIALFALYAFYAFDVFIMRKKTIPKQVAQRLDRVQLQKKMNLYEKAFERKKDAIFNKQFGIIVLIHIIAFSILFLKSAEIYGKADKFEFDKLDLKILGLCLVELMFFYIIRGIYFSTYRGLSKLLFNNMFLLMDVGTIILTRLKYQFSIKQFIYILISVFASLLIPVAIDKFENIDQYAKVYLGIGLGLILIVFLFGAKKNGATNWLEIGPISLQPSELVKIFFVLGMAGLLEKAKTVKDIAITMIIMGAYVGILVIGHDLGAALLLFVTYLIMLFVATKNKWYIFTGLGLGSLAAIVGYHIFTHVRTRVYMWNNPWDHSRGDDLYQACGQMRASLYAIAAGGWFGLGIGKGIPNVIPVGYADAIFAVICEELGVIVGILIVLICISCFIMFINIAMLIKKLFYKLIAIGLSITFVMQVILNVGGTVKYIPLTGVTLPFVSHGGTSIVCSVFVFSVIQGLYVKHESSANM